MKSFPKPKKQAVVIVLDSVGIGEAPDAADFGDVGSDTLGHIDETVGGFRLPNLARLGLGNIERSSPLTQIPARPQPQGAFGRLQETAIGKDTATGHWEFMGLVMDEPFQTYPDGFPAAFIEKFVEATGVSGVLGNKAASGTVIIEELGAEHIRTGKPIVYTSADPVFQIAAHEDVVPVETLYGWCEAAFDMMSDVGLSRVIARPFVGDGPYERTHRRKDFALEPPREMFLDELAERGIRTLGIGKIPSIYSGRGIAGDIHTQGNADGIEKTISAMKEDEFDFVFTNLVDFDSEYGHRRNPQGYAECLMRFDQALPDILAALGREDLLIITADHGNDPTYPGTDHTREFVPLLAYSPSLAQGRSLGTRATFADLGKTILDYFGVTSTNPLGTSFLGEMRKG